MTTLLILFIVSLMFSLSLTPVFKRAGIRFGAIDLPGERKLHDTPIPRTGGAAIFLSFILVLAASTLFQTKVSDLFVLDKQLMSFFAGAAVCFGIGLLDDFRSVGPKKKLLCQLAAASIAYWGGLRIQEFAALGVTIHFGTLSYPFTLFWFVLFINAVNLMDGMDGLAAGVVFFTSMVMVFIAAIGNSFLIAAFFAALAGSILGFLRYNLHPAKIFLGDGGSYFLGYMVAGLSIWGAFKSPVGFLLLVPLVALGVPLFDTILSPLRRFLKGKKIFSADQDHVHHRLLRLGFTTQTAVFLIYAITFCLCVLAVVLVNLRDERAGLFIILLGAGAILFFRMLGYSDMLGRGVLLDWMDNVSDDVSFSRQRRIFLGLQSEIVKSKTVPELWQNLIPALETLRFDKASFYLNIFLQRRLPVTQQQLPISTSDHPERRRTSAIDSSVIMRKAQPDLKWLRSPLDMEDYICSRAIFRLEIPLIGNNNRHYGTLVLAKDTKNEPVDEQTLRRISDLKRTITRAMVKISKNVEMDMRPNIFEKNGPELRPRAKPALNQGTVHRQH